MTLGAYFPDSVASRVAALHRQFPDLTAAQLAEAAGTHRNNVHKIALARGLRLPKAEHRSTARTFQKFRYAGSER